MSETQPKSKQPETSEGTAPKVAGSPPKVASSPPAPSDSGPGDVAPILPPEHWTEIQQQDDDADSSLGDDAASSTASLASSILKYRTIQGRTFHADVGDAQYWGANDERQIDSLDILHHLFTLALDGQIYIAPIHEPKKVLDIGTGTGIWAIDFADQFPACEVIGTDISPIQPGWVPPNLKFEIEDCTREWTFSPNEFDFVHIRYLLGSIMDWTEFFKQAYKVLKPGGYLESYEASVRVYSDDDTLPGTSAIAQWTAMFIDGGKKIGRSFDIVENNDQNKAMKEAGFVDIQEKWIKIPAGGWARDPRQKEIGTYASLAVERDIEGFILFVTNVQGWSREQVTVYAAHLRKELKSLKHHVWYWQKVVWGRKPESE